MKRLIMIVIAIAFLTSGCITKSGQKSVTRQLGISSTSLLGQLIENDSFIPVSTGEQRRWEIREENRIIAEAAEIEQDKRQKAWAEKTKIEKDAREAKWAAEQAIQDAERSRIYEARQKKIQDRLAAKKKAKKAKKAIDTKALANVSYTKKTYWRNLNVCYDTSEYNAKVFNDFATSINGSTKIPSSKDKQDLRNMVEKRCNMLYSTALASIEKEHHMDLMSDFTKIEKYMKKKTSNPHWYNNNKFTDTKFYQSLKLGMVSMNIYNASVPK